MVTPAARRDAVMAAREAHDISERQACSIIGADRNAMRYRHRRPDDAAARARLKELAAERRRFGWRPLKLLLARDPHEPQEATAVVYRGAATGAPSRRPQTSAWHASADDAVAGTEPALVTGLCR